MNGKHASRGLFVLVALILFAMTHSIAGRGPQVKTARPAPPPPPVAACRADAPEFDARRLGVVPGDPRNQAWCGSCWAFAAAAGFEISFGIMNPDVRPAGINLSEQHIMGCSIGSCDGGLSESALRWMKEHSIALESELGYQEKDFSCPFQDAGTDFITTDWGHVDKANPLYPSRGEIKAAICNHGSVVSAMRVTDKFHADCEGTIAQRASVAAEKTTGATNHVVAIIGWDDSRHAWLIRNSWGNQGERGYRWVDYNSHSIGYDAIWIDAKPRRAKRVEVRNKGAYVTDLTISYDVSGFHHVDENSFPAPQSRTRLVPEHARNVVVTAKAVAGRGIFTKQYPVPEDACFEVSGTTLDTEFFPCTDKPYNKPNVTKEIVVNNVIHRSAYVAKLVVTFKWKGETYREDRSIPVGASGKVEVPIEATDIVAKADAVAGKNIFTHRFARAEDACFEVGGTTLDTESKPCTKTDGCYRQIEIKNVVGSGYAAEATVSYSLDGKRRTLESGSFPIGVIKRMPVPCAATDVTMTAKAIAGRTIFTKTDEKAADRCYEVSGTTLSPRYQPCGAQTDCKRRIKVHNGAAYVAEFTVEYDYAGQRETMRSGSFAVGRDREISIPCDATNVRVHAKAVAGRDIFTKTYPKAEDVCFEVKGTTLNPRYEGC